MAKKQIRDLLRAHLVDKQFRMESVDPASTPGLKGGKKKAHRDIKKGQGVLFQLHERLYAERRRSLLVVLQGMDTAGKDGTVTHVMRNFNPQGVLITSFKQPTPQEKERGFLWRIRKRLPEPGYVGIFNRSHYEDVLIARVHNLAPRQVIQRRYGQINKFEAELVRTGTTVVKLCLDISYNEQRRRLMDRLKDPDKHWKFSEHDIDERGYWDEYMSAYGIAVTRCTTGDAPWYVIPANDKLYRNWAITKILVETLQAMDPQYPRPKLDIPRLMKRLKA